MDLCLQRNTLVIVYCLVITSTFCRSSFPTLSWMMWLISCIRIGLLTLMICLIMIATVVFGFRQRNEIVVVPIGMVFAFTQLRSSMPGIPDGFGTSFLFFNSEHGLRSNCSTSRQYHWYILFIWCASVNLHTFGTDFVGLLPCLILLSISVGVSCHSYVNTYHSYDRL